MACYDDTRKILNYDNYWLIRDIFGKDLEKSRILLLTDDRPQDSIDFFLECDMPGERTLVSGLQPLPVTTTSSYRGVRIEGESDVSSNIKRQNPDIIIADCDRILCYDDISHLQAAVQQCSTRRLGMVAYYFRGASSNEEIKRADRNHEQQLAYFVKHNIDKQICDYLDELCEDSDRTILNEVHAIVPWLVGNDVQVEHGVELFKKACESTDRNYKNRNCSWMLDLPKLQYSLAASLDDYPQCVKVIDKLPDARAKKRYTWQIHEFLTGLLQKSGKNPGLGDIEQFLNEDVAKICANNHIMRRHTGHAGAVMTFDCFANFKYHSGDGERYRDAQKFIQGVFDKCMEGHRLAKNDNQIRVDRKPAIESACAIIASQKGLLDKWRRVSDMYCNGPVGSLELFTRWLTFKNKDNCMIIRDLWRSFEASKEYGLGNGEYTQTLTRILRDSIPRPVRSCIKQREIDDVVRLILQYDPNTPLRMQEDPEHFDDKIYQELCNCRKVESLLFFDDPFGLLVNSKTADYALRACVKTASNAYRVWKGDKSEYLKLYLHKDIPDMSKEEFVNYCVDRQMQDVDCSLTRETRFAIPDKRRLRDALEMIVTSVLKSFENTDDIDFNVHLIRLAYQKSNLGVLRKPGEAVASIPEMAPVWRQLKEIDKKQALHNCAQRLMACRNPEKARELLNGSL